MKSLGIDIGTYSVKIAEVEASNKSFILTRLEDFPLSTDPTKDTEIEVLDILRNLAQQYDSSNTYFVFALPQEQVVLRHREFPFRERHKILKSIPFELEDDIPFSGDNAIFDAKITCYRGMGAEVLACATPIERVSNRLQVANDGGIEPTLISVEGLAFANLLEEWAEPPQEGPPLVGEEKEKENDKDNHVTSSAPETAQAVLNIGHKVTLLVLWSNNRLVTARTLDWGGMDIAQALAKKYNLHVVEAIKELCKKSFILTTNKGATKDQIVFSDVIKGMVDNLVHELQLAFLEIESEHRVHVNKVFMSGGTCQIRNLGPYLTQKLDIAVNRFKHIPANNCLNFQSGHSGEVSSAIAIALAIEGFKRPRNPAINMIRGTLAKQSQTLKLFTEKWGHALAVASSAFVFLLIWSIMRDSFSEDISRQSYDQMKIQAKNVTRGEIKGSRATPHNIRKYIRKKKQEAKSLKLVEKVQTITSALDVLKKLTESTPSKYNTTIDIKKLLIDDELIEAQGFVAKASEIEVLSKAWKALSKDGKVEKFHPDFTSQKGKTPFGLRLKVTRLKGS